jgi:folylpolyglutamate synthase/dihydropteroate synthase
VQSIQSARAFPDLESVIAAACAVASSRFLVCGSLYLMGEMLKKNNARGTVGGDVAGDTPEDVSGDATDG